MESDIYAVAGAIVSLAGALAYGYKIMANQQSRFISALFKLNQSISELKEEIRELRRALNSEKISEELRELRREIHEAKTVN